MGCSLEGAIAIAARAERERAIDEGRLSRELWVVAPADNYGWSDMRSNDRLQRQLIALPLNALRAWSEQVHTTKNGKYRRVIDVDCPSVDLSQLEHPIISDINLISRLKGIGAHGDFYFYVVRINNTPKTAAKLAILKKQHPLCTFAVYFNGTSRTYAHRGQGDFSH